LKISGQVRTHFRLSIVEGISEPAGKLLSMLKKGVIVKKARRGRTALDGFLDDFIVCVV
jgi:hypothetical protein